MQIRNTKASAFGRIVRAVSDVFPENYFLQVSRYQIHSRKIPLPFRGFRIVQLSDLHGCSFGRDNNHLLKKVAAEVPDAVMMTGDMADRYTSGYDGLFQFAGALCRRYPVYFVSGNHELDLSSGHRREFLAGLRTRGVHVMDNTSEEIKRGGEKIRIYGFRLPLRYYRSDGQKKSRPKFTVQEICRVLGPCDSKEYTVLLAHNPLCFDTYAEWGASLTLSGHVHGGMIRLPHFGGFFSPERRFFPRYWEGVYSSGQFPERKMVVSRGLGRGARIHNIPEVVVLTLNPVGANGVTV